MRYPILGNFGRQKTCLPAMRHGIVDDADVALTLMAADRMCIGLHGAICDCTNGCTTDPLCFPAVVFTPVLPAASHGVTEPPEEL
ncbi:MAG: hypothetical protein KME19_25095 [Microcoleus vaginatus WJT46-NPBG5]|nr:hypothetical protein [Microcoleus vaginatus WJT46-NPBG5]